MADSAREQAQRAGRGGLAVLVAKVFFIGTGLLQQALLPRAIGLADYGALSRVLAVSNVFNNVLVSSSTQGVSRTVAAAGPSEREALRAALRVHGIVALLSALLLAGVAPLVAHFQAAPDVVAPLVVMSGVLAIYGVYAPLVGYLNGRRAFTRQAALDIVAATLRTTGLLGAGWLFAMRLGGLATAVATSPGLLGATVGAVLASAGVFALALRWTGTGSAGATALPGVPGPGAYLRLIVPVMVAQLFTNGLMQADIFLLGRYVSLAATSQVGLADHAHATTAANAANEWVAVYRACQLFAFLPYQLLFSVTQVLFPMLAQAKAEAELANDDASKKRVAELVGRGCRVGAIVCGMLVCVVLAMPESLVKFAYGAQVASRAVSTLRVLCVGQAAFAMFGLATTVLVSLGRERDAMAITGLALAALVLSCLVSVTDRPFGEPQLLGTAKGVLIGLTVGLSMAGTRAWTAARAFIPWKTALRVGGCIATAYLAGGVVPVFSKLLTPIVAAGVVFAYLAALVVTGELGKDDLGFVVSILARRARK